MGEHVVSLYDLNDITADELRRHLPRHPGVRFTDLPPGDDPLAHRDALADATIVLAPLEKEHRIGPVVLDAMPRCRLVQSVAVGYDGVDHAAAAARGIPVSNLPGFNSDAVADWTVGAMLALLRRYAAAHRVVESGGWGPDGLRGRDLSALTVGILGFGSIGRAVARRLDGFGCAIVVHDPVRTEPRTYLDLEDLLARADVLSVHLPLLESTANLLDDKRLGLLPDGAYVVNAGRGGVLDEAALVRALDAGRLGGAALDVFAVEPLPAGSPLRGRTDVLLTPHTAGVTAEAYHNLRNRLFARLDAVLSGEPPADVVNGVAAK